MGLRMEHFLDINLVPQSKKNTIITRINTLARSAVLDKRWITICGKYLIAGTGYRSDIEAQQFAAATLGLEPVLIHAKPQLNDDGSEHINPVTNHADSLWYDLDLAVSVINNRTIAYCPDALDEESNKKLQSLNLDRILVDYEECTKGFANNLVSTGKHVIMSNKAPKLQAELEKRGLICLTPDVTELKKGGGYIRCASLWLS